MEHFFQAAAAVLLAVILMLCLKKSQTGIGEMISIFVCSVLAILAISYLKPVIEFIQSIQRLNMMDNQLLKTVFKVVGICVIAEIVELICIDSGNSAMGKALQLLSSAVVVWLAIPLMTSFLELIEGVLKGI